MKSYELGNKTILSNFFGGKPFAVSYKVLEKILTSFIIFFLAVFQRQSDATSIISKYYLLISIGLCFLFIALFLTRLADIGKGKRNYWYFLFLLAIPITGLWSQVPSVTFEKSIYLICSTLFAYYLYLRFTFSELVKVIITGLSLVLLASLILIIIAPDKVIHTGFLHFGAWKGIYYHKSGLGREMALLALLFFYQLRKPLNILLFFVCVFVVMKSESIIGLLALSMIITYVFYSNSVGRVWEIRRYFIMIFIAAVSVIAVLVFSNLNTFLAFVGKDITFNGRLQIWLLSLYQVRDNFWLGFGYESFWLTNDISYYIGWVIPHAHNMLIDLVLDGGILLLSIFLIMNILLFKALFRQKYNRHFFSVSITYLILLFMTSMTEEVIYVPFNILWIFYSCIVFYSINEERTQDFDYYTLPIRWRS